MRLSDAEEIARPYYWALRQHKRMDSAERQCVWIRRILGVSDGAPSRQYDAGRRLVALRRVGRLLFSQKDMERALLFAKTGTALSLELGAAANAAAFKAEEVRILMMLTRHDEAVAAADQYAEFARKLGNKADELATYGPLISALSAAARYREADTVAEQALDRSRSLGDNSSIVKLLLHRMRFAIAEGRSLDAGDFALQVATFSAGAGDFDACNRALTSLYSVLDDNVNPAQKFEHLLVQSVKAHAEMMAHLPSAMRHDILRHAVDQVSRIMTLCGTPAIIALERWLGDNFLQPHQEALPEIRALSRAASAIREAQ
jgi:tetratricopeptide (TPR) repeat protein